MKLTLTALFDEETRKQVREAIFLEAKSIPRGEVATVVHAELKRAAEAAIKGMVTDPWRFRDLMRETLKSVVTEQWDSLKAQIEKLLEESANKIIAKKLADKTVFEAEKQHVYVAAVVRRELEDSATLQNAVRRELKRILGEGC